MNRVMMAAEPFARFASATAPVSNWLLGNRAVRWIMEKTSGARAAPSAAAFFPAYADPRMARRRPAAVRDAVRRVAFFADLFANYNCRTWAWRQSRRWKPWDARW